MHVKSDEGDLISNYSTYGVQEYSEKSNAAEKAKIVQNCLNTYKQTVYFIEKYNLVLNHDTFRLGLD